MLGQITDGVVRARSRSASIVSDDKSTKSTEAMGVSVQTLRPVKEDVPMIEEEVSALLYNLCGNGPLFSRFFPCSRFTYLLENPLTFGNYVKSLKILDMISRDFMSRTSRSKVMDNRAI
jgi:hypothetical protein